MKTLWCMVLLTSVSWAQIPVGSIFIDLSRLPNDSIQVMPERYRVFLEYEGAKPTLQIDSSFVYFTEGIYKSWTPKELYSSAARLVLWDDEFRECKPSDFNCREYFRAGSISFEAMSNSYWITSITRGPEEMLIYLYTSPTHTTETRNGRDLDYTLGANVFYNGITFQRGTYLINLSDPESPVLNCGVTIENRRLIFSSQLLEVAKIDDGIIWPKDLQDCFQSEPCDNDTAYKLLRVLL